MGSKGNNSQWVTEYRTQSRSLASDWEEEITALEDKSVHNMERHQDTMDLMESLVIQWRWWTMTRMDFEITLGRANHSTIIAWRNRIDYSLWLWPFWHHDSHHDDSSCRWKVLVGGELTHTHQSVSITPIATLKESKVFESIEHSLSRTTSVVLLWSVWWVLERRKPKPAKKIYW